MRYYWLGLITKALFNFILKAILHITKSFALRDWNCTAALVLDSGCDMEGFRGGSVPPVATEWCFILCTASAHSLWPHEAFGFDFQRSEGELFWLFSSEYTLCGYYCPSEELSSWEKTSESWILETHAKLRWTAQQGRTFLSFVSHWWWWGLPMIPEMTIQVSLFLLFMAL